MKTHTEDLGSASQCSSEAVQSTAAAAPVKLKCSASVWDRFHSTMCARNATKEHEGRAYCGTHYPPAVQAREEKSRKRWRENYERQNAERDERRKRFDAYPKLIEHLKGFEDMCPRMSDDDPIAPAIADLVRAARELLRELGEL